MKSLRTLWLWGALVIHALIPAGVSACPKDRAYEERARVLWANFYSDCKHTNQDVGSSNDTPTQDACGVSVYAIHPRAPQILFQDRHNRTFLYDANGRRITEMFYQQVLVCVNRITVESDASGKAEWVLWCNDTVELRLCAEPITAPRTQAEEAHPLDARKDARK